MLWIKCQGEHWLTKELTTQHLHQGNKNARRTTGCFDYVMASVVDSVVGRNDRVFDSGDLNPTSQALGTLN